MADVKIIREGPAVPPVQEVVLRLSEEEAREVLEVLYGGYSPAVYGVYKALGRALV